jgi:hypothetical protein
VPPLNPSAPSPLLKDCKNKLAYEMSMYMLKMIEPSVNCSLSTAACESPFCTLKQELSPHRMSMLHSRKVDLIITSFERDIAGKINCDWELLSRIWNSGPECRRRLQLY